MRLAKNVPLSAEKIETRSALTREEIMQLGAEQIETRRAEIAQEIETADEAGLDALDEEMKAIEERVKALNIETRRKNMAAVAGGAGTVLAKAPQKEQRTLADVLKSEEYVNAYAEYIKTGSEKECRALLTDLVEGGGIPVPTYLDEQIHTAWEKLQIFSRIRKINIKGTVKMPFEYSATSAAVHKEGADAPAEEQLELGIVEITPQMLKKWITMSDEVMAMKGQAFLDYIFREIEYRIYLLAEQQAVGAIKAAPATTTKEKAGVPTLEIEEIDAASVFKALALLVDDAASPVAIMNKKTYFNDFMSLKDSTGRPIYNVVSENGRPTYYINGLEVIFSETMTADEEFIVGDLDGLIANLPEGTDVKFTTDPYSLSEKDLVKVVGRMYMGLGVVRANYFVHVTVGGE